ncbi:MAG: hypothetical protein ACYCTE_06115 [Acidimicrobiales bacterium]
MKLRLEVPTQRFRARAQVVSDVSEATAGSSRRARHGAMAWIEAGLARSSLLPLSRPRVALGSAAQPRAAGWTIAR